MSSRRNFLKNSMLDTAAMMAAPVASFANMREQSKMTIIKEPGITPSRFADTYNNEIENLLINILCPPDFCIFPIAINYTCTVLLSECSCPVLLSRFPKKYCNVFHHR